MLPLGTKGNTHPPNVYANICQNVCITWWNNEMYDNFKDSNVAHYVVHKAENVFYAQCTICWKN